MNSYSCRQSKNDMPETRVNCLASLFLKVTSTKTTLHAAPAFVYFQLEKPAMT